MAKMTHWPVEVGPPLKDTAATLSTIVHFFYFLNSNSILQTVAQSERHRLAKETYVNIPAVLLSAGQSQFDPRMFMTILKQLCS